ncbi:MAG: FKBP-type peptidyl-prolyl cis-trans isomerase [Gammaproteobacteria bacterium]|nr:FKBP-type peptidyl-prolyl cis-trans isomerase [Gammaproteobacteria bacterium]
MNSLRHAIKVAAALIFLGGCGNSADAPEAPEDGAAAPAPESQPVAAEVVEIEPGLSMRVLAEGNGDVATAGQVAVVHYTGWLFDPAAPDNRGAKFDSSLDRDQHFRFPIGGQRVIRGWDRGVAGMKIGEKRELTIAPELAYGERDLGIIPPGSTLVFEIDLAGLEGTAP